MFLMQNMCLNIFVVYFKKVFGFFFPPAFSPLRIDYVSYNCILTHY